MLEKSGRQEILMASALVFILFYGLTPLVVTVIAYQILSRGYSGGE